jgi:Ca-activated chloride channel family protein
MLFANLQFADPRWLWLAVLGPVALFALQAWAARARRRQLARLAAPEAIADLTRSHSPARRRVKEVLLLVVLAAFGVALARPQWGEAPLTQTQLVGEDIVFALDCSRSMLAADVSPNRLQRARLAILDFVQRHGRGRVGLVAFSGQAFLQCPLTFDHDAFRDALLAVDERAIALPGTDVGRALDEAFRALDKKSRTKTVVLVTDGEDLENSGVRQAERLATNGVVVHTVGVGTPAGAEIQVRNEQGQIEVVRDAKGEIVRSRLDETTLRAIAAATKGAYHPLGPAGEGLARIQTLVQNLRPADASGPGRRMGVERFHLFVALALALVVGESLIGTRRKE